MLVVVGCPDQFFVYCDGVGAAEQSAPPIKEPMTKPRMIFNNREVLKYDWNSRFISASFFESALKSVTLPQRGYDEIGLSGHGFAIFRLFRADSFFGSVYSLARQRLSSGFGIIFE
jgi:hypothetical protein